MATDPRRDVGEAANTLTANFHNRLCVSAKKSSLPEKKHGIEVHKSAKVVGVKHPLGWRSPRCDICSTKTPHGRERVRTIDGEMMACQRCAGNLNGGKFP